MRDIVCSWNGRPPSPERVFALNDKGVHGSLERAVALDSKEHDTDKPVWIQIAKVGQWSGHPAGPFQLSSKDFDEMIRSFRGTTNQMIPIDFEHASEMPAHAGTIPFTGAPAQGWIVDLDNRGAQGLWALVRWLEPARTYIKEGKYRFFSPTIRFNSPDPKTGQRGCRLSSGALTNQPFLDGMAPLAAKDTNTNAAPEKDSLMTPEQIAQLMADKAALEAKVASLTAEVKTLKDEAASAKLTLKDVQTTNDKNVVELETLRKFKAETETKLETERVDLAFATYKDEKKLTEDDKVAMKIVLNSNPAHFEKLYPKAQPGTPHMLRNLSGGEEAGGQKRPPVQPNGGEELTIVQLADKISKERNVDRETAFGIAERQLRAKH